MGESDESVIERHSKLLDRFTQRLADRRITLSTEKSSFFQKSIDFLGYTLGRDGVSIQEQKRAAIIDTRALTHRTHRLFRNCTHL